MVKNSVSVNKKIEEKNTEPESGEIYYDQKYEKFYIVGTLDATPHIQAKENLILFSLHKGCRFSSKSTFGGQKDRFVKIDQNITIKPSYWSGGT